jgi:hypothetical protein
MGIDRSLDEEGIPDLEGPLPEKAATGDPQEGMAPPSDHPASFDYGVTVDEQSRPEPLDDRIARELPEEESSGSATEAGLIVEPEDEALGLEDDEKEMVGRAVGAERIGLSAEEAAVHVRDEP